MSDNTTEGNEKTLNSIINQTLNFNENIEIIIVDDNSNNSSYIHNKYIAKFPNNIKYLHCNSPICENIGIDNAKGEYIFFLKANDTISEKTLENTLEFINSNQNTDLISLPIYYFKNGKQRYLNHKIKDTKTFDLNKNPEQAQLLGPSTIIKKDSVKNLRILNEHNGYNAFLSEISLNKQKLGICKTGSYYIENIEEKMLPIEEFAISNEEYLNFIENNIKYIIERAKNKFSEIPKFVQYELLNQFNWISNIEESKEQLDLSKLEYYIKYIDDNIILNNIILENDLKIFLFLLKFIEI